MVKSFQKKAALCPARRYLRASSSWGWLCPSGICGLRAQLRSRPKERTTPCRTPQRHREAPDGGILRQTSSRAAVGQHHARRASKSAQPVSPRWPLFFKNADSNSSNDPLTTSNWPLTKACWSKTATGAGPRVEEIGAETPCSWARRWGKRRGGRQGLRPRPANGPEWPVRSFDDDLGF